jgi:hypothetical protein
MIEKIFGSLTTKKYDVESAIAQKQHLLTLLSDKIAIASCPGWLGLKIELEKAADAASYRILELSQNPQDNANPIIAEGARRLRDLQFVRDIELAQKDYNALNAEIQSLIKQANEGRKKKSGFGLVR